MPDDDPKRYEPRHAATADAERPPRRASASTTVAVLAVLFVASGLVMGTSAAFNASTTNSNSFATATLVNPTGAALGPTSLTGDIVTLGWTPGSADTLDVGHRIRRSDSNVTPSTTGTPSGCGSANYATAAAPSGPNPRSFVATPTATASDQVAIGTTGTTFPQGRWVCWEVDAVAPCCNPTPTSNYWTATSPAAAVYNWQVGFVVQSLRIDGNSDNRISTGDIVEIFFNQPVDLSAPNVPKTSRNDWMCLHGSNQSGLTDALKIGIPTSIPYTESGCDSVAINEVTIGGIDFNGGWGNGTDTRWLISEIRWNDQSQTGATYPCAATNNCVKLSVYIGTRSGDNPKDPGAPNIDDRWLPTQMTDALRSNYPGAGGTKYQICPTDPANGRCRVLWQEMANPNDI